MLDVVTIVVGDFMTNCYLVYQQSGAGAMVVDPGNDGERIVQEIAKRNLAVTTIFNTHGHVDHIAANETVKSAFPEAQIVISEIDAPMLASPIRNLSALFLARVKSPPPDRTVTAGDTVTIGTAVGRVLETPGHTPGGIALYFDTEQNEGKPLVFSGDALFQMSIGRTDFPGGDAQELVRSVRRELLSLPGETIVYPGHGEPTRIDDECRNNPFVAARIE